MKRQSFKWFSTIIFFIVCKQLISQISHTNILVSKDGNIFEPQECTVTLNPANPSSMMVVAHFDNCYISTDYGYTWQHDRFPNTNNNEFDPCIFANKSGKFYYVSLSQPALRIRKKNNLQSDWSPVNEIINYGTKDPDKEWATYDDITNTVYVSWTKFDTWGSSNPNDSSVIFLSRSEDEGNSWTEPVRISDKGGNAQGGNASVHASMPATGLNGELFVTWVSPGGIMFDKSTDKGEHWLKNDKLVTTLPRGWFSNVGGFQRSPGFPIIKSDLSNSVHKGNIYISWYDSRKGWNDADVWLCRSTDSGNSWSQPIRVNDDPAGKHNFFSWMTVDQVTGYIYIVFYDRRNYSDLQTDVYLAQSKDGGVTFKNFKISQSPFLPSTAVFLGDYISIDAHNNVVRPVWVRQDEAGLSLVTAIVNTDILNGVINEKISENSFSLYQNYPNPFNPETIIKYEIKSNSDVKLEVYNILGKMVKVLVDGNKNKGIYSVSWNGKDDLGKNLANGVYFYKLTSGKRAETKVAILIK